MPRKEVFASKLLERIDRIDQKALRDYLQTFIRENAFLEDVLKTLEEGIVILNQDMTLFFVNEKAAEWLGIDPTSIKPNVPFLQSLADPELQKKFKNHFYRREGGRSIEHVKMLIPHEMALKIVFIPFRRPDENKTLILVVPSSGSNEIERLSHMASLVKLASGIAHEIGNPLNSIIIHLSLLMKQSEKLPDSLKKELDKHLHVIRSEAERLDKIIRNFLKATRNPPLRFKVDNFNDLLDETLEFLGPELKSKDIKVLVEKDSKLPPSLFDREKMHQVFLNIIKNAMEAMPRGGKLWIKLFHKSKVLWIEFKDEGHGIKDEDLPYIFDAYFTTKESGSGLGLMTVYNIIREHGGRIQAKSTPGKGSIFSIILPLRQPKLQLPQPNLAEPEPRKPGWKS